MKKPNLSAFIALLGVILAIPAGAEKISIGGTGSALESMRVVAEEFKKRHPGAEVVIPPSLGSTGGIKAVLAGAVDIALSARPLKDEERRKGAVEMGYARTPFVFATSKKNKVDEITTGELVDIYSGKTINWPDGKSIRLILRPVGETETELVKSISPEMREAVIKAENRPGMLFAVTDHEGADHIEKVEGAIGSSTLALIISESRDIKALKLNGVEPGTEALRKGAYPYYKPLFLVTGPKPSPPARKFIEFLESEEGRRIMSGLGWVVGSWKAR